MEQKEVYYDRAVMGARWLANIVQPNGKFIYGYHVDTLQMVPGYNILRHAGACWAMLDVYSSITTNTPEDYFIYSQAKKAIDWMLENHTAPFGNKQRVVMEDFAIKLGGNGLAVLALLKCSSIKYNDKYMEAAEDLCHYIMNCFDQDLTFSYHKRDVYGKDTKFRSGFYPGEALYALIDCGITMNNKVFIDSAIKGVLAYYNLRSQYGHVRDHWMAQAIEQMCVRVNLKKEQKILLRKYVEAIAQKELTDAPSKAAGPTACRSEALLSCLACYSKKEEIDSDLRPSINNLMKFQFMHQIMEGLSKGAFIHHLGSTEVRNDYCQHNISSFIRIYRYLRGNKK